MRRQTTEKLRLARPDLAIQPQLPRQESRPVGQEAVSTLNSILPTNGRGLEAGVDEMDEDVEIDWEKSYQLAEKVREAVRRGDRASEVLPRLTCLDGWCVGERSG